ncbi:hypothetical protein G7043_31270 [Lentzea sp. NEAU-D13]|uniref:Uncharacterized protein n=1 Tax=Lentzea alba TaxID=2714351 RepID=A0A7C9VTH3_9PSEU|nr:hypothetical protein [Lentzea alba]NGY63413.1 hypothetical protein [Lentzea alba]
MGAIAIVMLLGAVAIGLICWLGHHVHRETLRRRQVARVRAALAGHTSVAELRERCGADEMPRYPTPSGAAGDPDPAALDGSTMRVERAS